MLDVYEEHSEVVHVVETAVDARAELLCKVDWARRHDHMQQHTGQHILSQAIIQVCDIPTVGFTIGPDWSTIVLERRPDAEALDSALRLANSIVDENRPVEVLFPSSSEIQEIPLRGALPDKEAIRIIRVEGFDWSPCGGTHCTTTGDVRLVLLLGIHKEKDSYRLEFVCGQRAEATAFENARAISDIAALLDVGAPEIVERTRLLLDKTHSQEEMITELRADRVSADCARLLTSLGEGEGGVIAAVLDGRSVHELRQLAHMLVEQPGTVALLVGKDQEKTGLAFARSDDRTENMNQIMQSVCEATGCRGGGNAAFATGGGGGDVDAEKVVEVAKMKLESATG